MKCLCIFLFSSSWAVRTKTAVFTLSALLTSALCWISSSKQSFWPFQEEKYTGVLPSCFSAKANQSIRTSIHPFITLTTHQKQIKNLKVA